MRGVNKVILVGTLGQDPEINYTQGGAAIANISVATSEKWKDKNTGQMQEKTEWHRVVFFNKLAEIVGEYLKKGSKVYIEGSLQTRKWQDNQGQDRYTTEIKAREMQMLDSRQDGGQAQQEVPAQRSYNPTQQAPNNGISPNGLGQAGPSQAQTFNKQHMDKPKPDHPPQQTPAPELDNFDDDIPFN